MTKSELETAFTMLYGHLQHVKHIKHVDIDDFGENIECSVYATDDLKNAPLKYHCVLVDKRTGNYVIK